MPKSKHRKNHKKKVQARNLKIKENKAKMNKLQREFLMNLIKQEQEKGLFENMPTINPVGPDLNLTSSLDGPILDGPILDTPIVENTNSENTTSESSNETVSTEGPAI